MLQEHERMVHGLVDEMTPVDALLRRNKQQEVHVTLVAGLQSTLYRGRVHA